MKWRAALLQPAGLVLLAGSALMAALPWVAPAAAPWSDRTLLLLVCGLMAFGSTIAVAALPRRPAPYPSVRQLSRIRQAMLARLADMKEAPGDGANSALAPVVADAVRHLEDEVLPKLVQIEARHQALARQMARYEAGALPLPAESIMARLKATHALQEQAIAACVQQAANAEAILVALAHEADDARTVRRTQAWSQELRGLHDRLSEVLGGGK